MDFVLKNTIELHATQTKLCLPILDRLYKKMLLDINFHCIKVCDNLIIDGHHRYLASLLANFNLEIAKTPSPSVVSVISWNSIEYVDEDWDTPAKINMLNEQDANYNHVSLSKIVESLNMP